jgi:hypothetical protein
MSLLHPTTSDIWDRIIVLQLKIEHATREGKPSAHFSAELKELSCVAHDRRFPSADHLGDLRSLHEAIWDGIAMMTARPMVTAENAMQLAKMAVNLQVWNGERVRIKHEIDKITGEYTGQEKI